MNENEENTVMDEEENAADDTAEEIKNKRISDKFWFITAAVLTALGLFFKFAITGHSMLAYTLWVITAAILWFVFLRYVREHADEKRAKAAKILTKISAYAVVAFLMVFSTTVSMIYTDSKTSPDPSADYVIVLGAGVNGTKASLSLTDRLNAAYDYLVKYPDAKAVLSGGMGPGEDITEAQCMYDWLVAKGISKDRLIKEEKAARTIENLSYSLDIINSLEGGDSAKVAVLTNEYHLMRAKLLAMRMGRDVVGVSAKTTMPTLLINHFIRESLGMWYYTIFEK